MRKVKLTSKFLEKSLDACDNRKDYDGLVISTDLLWNIKNVPAPLPSDLDWIASELEINLDSYKHQGPCWCGDPACTYGPRKFASTDTMLAAVAEIADVLWVRYPKCQQ